MQLARLLGRVVGDHQHFLGVPATKRSVAPIVPACVMMVISSIDVIVMSMTTLDAYIRAIMVVVIAGVFVSWSVAITIMIAIATNPDCHASRTNVNVLGQSGCRYRERKTKNQGYRCSNFHYGSPSELPG